MKINNEDKLEYTKGQINRAGYIVANYSENTIEYKDAIKIVEYWRSLHEKPLQYWFEWINFIETKKFDFTSAQRLKRIDSITSKIKRQEKMKLTRMNDLGGCRIITKNIDEVNFMISRMIFKDLGHTCIKKYDYIENPKSSGYRSVHCVYQTNDTSELGLYGDLKIEIQFRTELQHVWATALETMGIYTGQNLKASEGEDYILRFFTLISNVFAIEEKSPLIPNVTSDISEILKELRYLDNKHKILNKMSAISVTLNHIDPLIFTESYVDGYTLLMLNFETRTLQLKAFRSDESTLADMEYKKVENKKSDTIDAVLVRVKSFENLQKAYPNYFSDIEDFIKKVNHYIKNV